MEQLSGFDAFFIKSEFKSAPQHISHVYIYDPSSSDQAVIRFKDILQNYQNRLHLAPVFRRQIKGVPFSLDDPYWVDAPDFDIEYHVRHIALPKPGDWRQLCIQLARLHSQNLDLSRPMWQAYVIEGLDGVDGMPPGAFAIMTKMHHAMVDGKAALQMLESIHDHTPTVDNSPPPEMTLEPEPDTPQLLMQAGKNMLKQPGKSFSKLKKIVSTVEKKRQSGRNHSELVIKQSEKTPFNYGITSSARVWGAGLFNIKDIIEIKQSVEGATLNDVILCITSYAVEQYLAKHDTCLQESLIAGMAVDTRAMTEYDTGTNHATLLSVCVHSHIKEPLERLIKIHAESELRKELLAINGADIMRDVLDVAPSGVLNIALKVANRFKLLDRQNMGFHYATTNIPGPRTERYLAGSKVVYSFGLAPLTGTTGLAFVISSYCSSLSISFTCCRDSIKDPDFLEQCIYDAFQKVQLASRSAKPSSKKKVAAKPVARKASTAQKTSK